MCVITGTVAAGTAAAAAASSAAAAGTAAAAAGAATAAGTAAAAGTSLATYAALAASALGAGMSAYSSYQSGKNQQKIADYNAKVQEIQAQDARARGGFEANQKRREVAAVLGQQQAQLAANGVETSSGTALTLASDTAWAGEMDAKTIEVNALRAAYGYEQEAVGTRLQGKAAMRNARGEAYGSLLSGVGKTGTAAYSMLK